MSSLESQILPHFIAQHWSQSINQCGLCGGCFSRPNHCWEV